MRRILKDYNNTSLFRSDFQKLWKPSNIINKYEYKIWSRDQLQVHIPMHLKKWYFIS